MADLWHCQAGCTQSAVQAALKDRGLLHELRDPAGKLLAMHERKGRWIGPDGTVRLASASPRDLLYGIETLASTTDPVVLVEGEKAADALREKGIAPVLGTVCGASSIPTPAVLAPLAGREVVLWPDNDEPGRQHMDHLATALQELDCSVRVVEVIGAAPKDDAADYIPGHSDEELRAILDRAPKWKDSQPVPWFTATELMAREFPEPKWAVPGIIAEGFTLFAGKPKLGKSWFALNLGLAIAAGGVALGRVPVPQGDVLYLALEDTPRRVKNRLCQVLGTEPSPERLCIATEWLRSDQGGVDQIRKWIRKCSNPRLVIIDTLAKFRPLQKDDHGTGYTADYAAIDPLRDLAGKQQVAIMAITHQRKMGSDDWVDTISGTLGLAGSADALAGIFRERGSKDCVLKVTGRDVEEQDLGLRFDDSSWSWRLLGSVAEVRLSPDQQQVVDLIQQHGPLTPTKAANAAGKTVDAMKQLLRRMAEAGKLEPVDKGHYALPEPMSPMSPMSPTGRPELQNGHFPVTSTMSPDVTHVTHLPSSRPLSVEHGPPLSKFNPMPELVMGDMGDTGDTGDMGDMGDMYLESRERRRRRVTPSLPPRGTEVHIVTLDEPAHPIHHRGGGVRQTGRSYALRLADGRDTGGGLFITPDRARQFADEQRWNVKDG